MARISGGWGGTRPVGGRLRGRSFLAGWERRGGAHLIFWLLSFLLLLGGSTAAQTLPGLPPEGLGAFVIGGLGGRPVEVGAVRHFAWYSAAASLMPGGEGDPTRLVISAGPHLTRGPVRVYARAGAGYEWEGSGRPVLRLTYGAELGLKDGLQLLVQGATSFARPASGWTRSEATSLSLGLQLFFGPSLAEQERAALQEAHPGWPPELVELVAQGEVSLALAEAHYPDWSVEQLRLVSQGRVVPGMSPAMVAAAWGAPDEILEVTDPQLGPVLRWRYIETVGQYDFFTGTPRFWEEVRRTVLFRDGVVVRVEQGP